MSDIYQAPSAELTESTTLEGFGSLERGKAGQFDFSIRNIISEAWDKTKGAKGTLWLAWILYVLVLMPVVFGVPFILELFGLSTTPAPGELPSVMMSVTMILTQVVIMAITLPLGAGIFMIGLKIACGAPVSATEVFAYYNKAVPLFVAVMLMYILILLGFVLFIIPGIYLMFAYYLSVPLIAEKGLGPWQALEASRKAVSKRWFRFVGLGISIILLVMIAMIPLGIGLIWVLPMASIAYGIVYRNIFGFEGKVAA